MTNTKPDKPEGHSNERHSNEQLKGNLGQKEARLEKEKDSALSHLGEKSSKTKKKSSWARCGEAVSDATVDWSMTVASFWGSKMADSGENKTPPP
jgi:hypothetical protein